MAAPVGCQTTKFKSSQVKFNDQLCGQWPNSHIKNTIKKYSTNTVVRKKVRNQRKHKTVKIIQWYKWNWQRSVAIARCRPRLRLVCYCLSALDVRSGLATLSTPSSYWPEIQPDVARSMLCVSVCVGDTGELCWSRCRLWRQTRVSPVNHMLNGDPDSSTGRGIFEWDVSTDCKRTYAWISRTDSSKVKYTSICIAHRRKYL